MLLVEKLGAFFCAVKFNGESSTKSESDREDKRKYEINDKEYKYNRENIREEIYENIDNKGYVYVEGISEKYSV